MKPRKKKQTVKLLNDRDLIDLKIMELDRQMQELYEKRRVMSLIGFKSPGDYR